jgi:prepilin-type processing-associated H-X9-DG protein
LTATARIAHEANVISQFIIRIATRLDGGGSRYIGNNGAAEILAQYTNDGNLVARVAPVGVDGGVVNWGLGSNWQLGLDGLKVNGLFIDGHVFSNGNGFYQILPGGKIMQWGKATRGAAQHVQPFPVPFTDLNSVVVNATPNQVNIAKKEVSAMLNGITVNNFTYQVRDIDGNNATFESSQINWLAFGF